MDNASEIMNLFRFHAETKCQEWAEVHGARYRGTRWIWTTTDEKQSCS